MRLLYIGRSRLHGLWRSLVCLGLSPLRRFKCTTRWLDGDRIPLPKHSGVDVFRRAADIPVMIIFVGLSLIYAIEIPTRLFSWNAGSRLVGLSVCHQNLAYVL